MSKRICLLLILLFPQITFAATLSADIHDILNNLRAIITPLTTLLIAICYIGGIALIFRGLGMLKIFGMPLTHMSRTGELGGPLVYIVVGSVLLYVPIATNILSVSIFGRVPELFSGGTIRAPNSNVTLHFTPTYRQDASSELLAYIPGAGNEWADLINTLVMFIQLVGFIAFIRGWFILSHAGQPGVQPGTLSRGMIHLIGGIIAINFVPFMSAIGDTIF